VKRESGEMRERVRDGNREKREKEGKIETGSKGRI
jgi:hypothetical protein